MNTFTQAQQLLREGRIEEAERICERLLQDSPQNAEALNLVGLSALRRGEHTRALSLLGRAASSHPADFHSRYHLARACDEAGDAVRARVEFQAAVNLQPAHYLARLYLANLMDRAGESDQAFPQYARALNDAQLAGHWLNAGTTPLAIQPLVERAVTLIRGTRRAIAEGVLARLRATHGSSELARVEQALRIFMREEAAQYPDPRQRPTLFPFPGLPASPYLDRGLFDWIDALEQQTPAICAELLRLLPGSAGRERVFMNEATERANLRGSGVAPSWNGYYFYRHGRRRDDNCTACPQTAQAVDALPLARVPAHGPEVLYSVFTPGTHLLPHQGVTNTRAVGHLPLLIPRDCALRVGGELHVWQTGRVVVFDDTYAHEAWNRSDQIRVVMIFDVWNPHLTPVEREAVAELLPRMAAISPGEAA